MLYHILGALDRAEDMHEKSLALSGELGAAPNVEHIEILLAGLLNERP